MKSKPAPTTSPNSTIPSVHDKAILADLQSICDKFRNSHDDDPTDAWESIDSLNLDIGGKNRVTSTLRAGIVDLIRTGHANDGLAMAILDKVYMQRYEYCEIYEVCNDLLNLEGNDRRAMMQGILVEYLINRTVYRIINSMNPETHKSLAPKFLDLLKKRADELKMNIDMRNEETDKFQRVLGISRNVYARRKLGSAITLDTWLKACYPRMYAFLGLSPKKTTELVKKRVDLVYYASMARESLRLAGPPLNALDGVESMIRFMNARNMPIHDTGRYATWRRDMRKWMFLQYAFEMRLYVHLCAINEEAELEPAIDGGRRTDLRVHDCYIEAYAPRDVVAMEFGHILPINSRSNLLRKTFSKRQIRHFGARQSLLIVEDPHNYVTDDKFQGKLAKRIRGNRRLSGVLVAKDMGQHYQCALVKNPKATSPIQPTIEEMVMRALGTPYA